MRGLLSGVDRLPSRGLTGSRARASSFRTSDLSVGRAFMCSTERTVRSAQCAVFTVRLLIGWRWRLNVFSAKTVRKAVRDRTLPRSKTMTLPSYSPQASMEVAALLLKSTLHTPLPVRYAIHTHTNMCVCAWVCTMCILQVACIQWGALAHHITPESVM